MEDLCKKQAEIIKLLTDAILINSKQEYIKSIKHICIAIITSFTILICFFCYMYFTSDYSEEIRAKNTTEHTENPPIHTQGIAICGEVELEFVDKIGMAELIGIE